MVAQSGPSAAPCPPVLAQMRTGVYSCVVRPTLARSALPECTKGSTLLHTCVCDGLGQDATGRRRTPATSWYK